MPRKVICLLILIPALAFLIDHPVLGERLVQSPLFIGYFSKGPTDKGLPENWEELRFKKVKPTHYVMVQDNGSWVVKAVSFRSASGLIRRMDLNPGEYPVISWRWKAENLLEKSNLTEKSGDDHPARIYIGFEYDRSNFNWMERLFYWMIRLFYGKDYPSRALNYIWASEEPVGTIHPNPYTDWVRTLVVESGEQHLNQWVEIERNVYDDYRQAFGEPPPRITGVGIMTDSDSTNGAAVTYYGDILFKT